MYCANCGAKLDEGSKFCHNCGAQVQAAAPVQQPEVPAAAVPQLTVPDTPVPAQPVPDVTDDIPVLEAEFIEEPASVPQPSYQTVPRQDYTAQTPSPAPDSPQSFSGDLPVYTAPVSGSGKEGSGKKILRAVIAVIAILAVLGGGYLALFGKGGGLPGVDYAAKGKEAFEAGDYENAVTYLENAYKKYPSDTEIESMLYSSHQNLAMNFYLAGDYESSESHLLRMTELAGDGSLDSGMVSFYTEWLERITRGMNTSDPGKVLKKAGNFMTDDELSYYSDFFSDIRTPEELAELIAGFYDKGQSPRICLLLDRHEDIVRNAVNSSGNSGYTVSVTGYEYPYVVFRTQRSGEGYSAYVGELDSSGSREGMGAIYCYRENYGDPYLYYYLSEWQNDLPNGVFVEFVLKDEGFTVYNSYKGNLINGHYDGSIIERYDDGVEYQSYYSNGVINPLGTDDEGRTIIAYAMDGSEKYLYSTISGTDNNQYGVDEY